MKRVVLVVPALTVLGVSIVLHASPAEAVINGTFDGDAHPHVGALDLRSTGRRIPCTGTLISPTVFLTAGHCTSFLSQAGLTQAAVTFDPVFSDTATFHVGAVHTNPAYVPFMTGAQADSGDLGVIVFTEPVTGIDPATLPSAGLLDALGPSQLKTRSFPTVGYGITRLLGGSNGGGAPDIDRDSSGTRMLATQTFLSISNGWLRLSMLDDGQVCTGDSGAPNFLGTSDTVVAIGVSGDFACAAMDGTLRIDTPSARFFLGQFVELP